MVACEKFSASSISISFRSSPACPIIFQDRIRGGSTHVGVRTRWYSFLASGWRQLVLAADPAGPGMPHSPFWSSGSTWMPVEPLPTTAIVLPAASKPSGQLAVWIMVPWKLSRPGTLGHFQLLSRLSLGEPKGGEAAHFKMPDPSMRKSA